jgi:hypothetical protein
VILIPSVILSDDGVADDGSIQGPWALVFDATGNLWSSNANAPNTVVEFAKAVQTTTGDPMLAVTLSPAKEKHGTDTLAEFAELQESFNVLVQGSRILSVSQSE